MARRWWTRAIQWVGYGLGIVLAVLLFVVLLATQTVYGRERVRQVIVRLAQQQLLGSLTVGALHFGPGCALAIDSVVLRDPDNVLLAQLGPTRATCRFGALVRGQLVLTSLDVARPHVVLQQSSGGVWSWSKAVRSDTTLPVADSLTERGSSPARLVVNGPIRIHDGTVVLEVPGQPRRVLDQITFNAPRVRTELESMTIAAEIEEISARLSEPSISLHRLSGSLSLVGDSAEVDLPFIGFGHTTTRLRGWMRWGAPGTPAMAVQFTADTLAFADLAWLAPEIPPDGGGRFEISVRSSGRSAPIDIAVRSADLHAMRSRVRGEFSFSIDSARAPAVEAAEISTDPLHTDLLRRILGDALPPRLRGALHARISARGQPGGRVRVNTFDARYADETGLGGISRVSANGDVVLGNDESSAALRVTAHAIDARTVASLDSTMRLQGVLRGTMAVNLTPSSVRIARADLRYAEGDSTMRITGGGRIDLGKTVSIDLKLEAQPLAPSAFGLSFPALSRLPSFEGPVEIRGSSNDLSLTAGLRNAGGAVAVGGRYRTTRRSVAISGTARLRDVDPRALSGRSTVPVGRLDADVMVDLKGDSLPVLAGKAEISQLAGTVSGITIEPSLARISLTESRVVAESVSIATSAGSVRLTGALARQRSGRDTMNLMTTLFLDQLRPLLQGISASDTTAPDSIRTMLDSASGTMTIRAQLSGSLDSMDVDADADGTRLEVLSVNSSRIHASASLKGLPGPLRGRFTLRADSVATQGVRFSTFTVHAVNIDSTWRVRLGTSPDDRPGGETSGSVSLRGDTVAVDIDSLLVRIPGSELRLVRPTRLRLDTSGAIVVDTVELRGTRGALLQAAGVVRDTGAIAVSLQVSNVPLNLASTTGAGDSLRTRIDVRADIGGTARRSRGNAQEPRAAPRRRLGVTRQHHRRRHARTRYHPPAGDRSRREPGTLPGPGHRPDCPLVLPVPCRGA